MLGWLLARTGFLSPRALHDLNALTYWVGLPALLFVGIAGASPEIGAVRDLMIVTFGATGAGILAAMGLARGLAVPAGARGTFVQGVFRGNLTFIGLPVVMYAFAGPGGTGGSAAASALLVFGPTVVLYNVLAILVLMRRDGDGGPRMPGGALRSLLTNPILIACIAGLVFSLSDTGLPVLVQRTGGAIGQMALPLALLCIGGSLFTTRLSGSLHWALAGALAKVLLLPALGLPLAWLVGLSHEHLRIALILLACPTASASYVLARQLGGDVALASGMILLSNLLALPGLLLVLALTV